MSKNLVEFASDALQVDDRARRRTNTSGKVANITPEQIEAGVTLEVLKACGVPVFCYHTQLTIHGKITNFDEDKKQVGYKAVVRNQNGTVGVRYIAVDGEKKTTIAWALSTCRKECRWYAQADSQGFRVVFHTMVKEEALGAMRGFPKSLVYGSIHGYRCTFTGAFIVYAYIGALQAENVWPLITALTGRTQAEVTAMRAEQDAADKAASEQRDREYKVAAANRDAELAQLRLDCDAKAKTLGRPLTELPKAGTFRRVFVQEFERRVLVRAYEIKRRGPVLCFTVLPTGALTSLATAKWKAVSSGTLAKWAAEAKAGFVFTL